MTGSPEDHLLSALEVDRDAMLRLVLRSIRHALGTPFQVIGGHAALLERGGEGRRPGDASVIARKTREMADLVQRAVDYTTPPRRQSYGVDVGVLVDEVCTALGPAAVETGVTLTNEIIDAPVRGDLVVAEFRHAVLSLLGVCIRMTSAGGAVEAKVTRGSPMPPPREAGMAMTGGAMAIMDVAMHGSADAETVIHREPWFEGEPEARRIEVALALVAGVARETGGWLESRSDGSGPGLRLVWPLGASKHPL